MGLEARVTAIAALLRSIGGIVIVAALQSLTALVAWVVAVSLVQAGYVAVRLRAAAGERSSVHSRHVDWRAVLSMGLMLIFVFTYLRIDAVLIGWLLDDRAVGFYAAAYTVMLGAQIAASMIGAALAPVFARTFAVDPAAFQRAWQSGLRAVLLIGVPVALGGSILAAPIIGRAYGAAYEPSAGVLAILIWGSPLAAIGVVVQAALRGAGREWWLLWVSGSCALFNVVANVWAIPRYGIKGAAVVTILTEAMSAAALVAAAYRARILAPPRLPAVAFIAALVALGVVATAAESAPVELALLASSAAYVAVLVLLGVLTREDGRELRSTLRRV